MLLFGYRLQLCEGGCHMAPLRGDVTGFMFVARIPFDLRHTWKSIYVCTRYNWKYISTTQNGQEIAHGVVLPESSV